MNPDTLRRGPPPPERSLPAAAAHRDPDFKERSGGGGAVERHGGGTDRSGQSMEGNQGRKKDTGNEAAAGGHGLNGRHHDEACGGEGSSWTVATWKTVQAGGSRASGTMGSL